MAEDENDESSTLDTISKQFLRIPLKRIGAVIGRKGSIRKEIESQTNSKIIIDSDTGEVEIRADKDLTDPVLFLKAKEVVRAIGRGFSSDQALKLANDDSYLEVIRLKPLIGHSSKQLTRVRSRLIGSKGTTRSRIEDLTKTTVVVSGSTISIIGGLTELGNAKEALMDIVKGSTIESVLGKLEEKRRKINKDEEKLWKSDEDEKSMSELFEEEQEKLDKTQEEDIFENFQG